MIRKILLLVIFTVWFGSATVGMGAPPSPSFTWVVKPHLYLSEVDNVYFKKKTITHVNHHEEWRSGSIVQTEWKHENPPPYVVVASRAQVKGFGKWKAEVDAEIHGHELSAETKWANFGSVGTLGPIPTWRSVNNLIIQAVCIDYFNQSPSPDQKKGYILSGSGKINIKQKEWTPYGEGGLPWGIVNGGSWGDGDTEEFTFPDIPSNGIGGYTVKRPTTELNSHVVLANPYKKVYWYVKPPSVKDGLGNIVHKEPGGPKKTKSSLVYDFNPSGKEGTFKITAYIYNLSDNSVYERSHNIEYSHNFNVKVEQSETQ